MRVLVTGIAGFVGSHLAEFLLEKGDVEIYGTLLPGIGIENVEPFKDKLCLRECDLKDAASVKKVMEEARPDRIFHLAAQAFVPASLANPADTLITNMVGQLNIFQAARELGLDPLIQIAASSDEYGLVSSREIPIKETTPLRPLNPYAVSKVMQDLLAYQYYQSYKLRAVRTRAFSHTGPRQGESFVASNFAKQVALIEAGKKEPVIHVGNLTAVRDFMDVRDVVKAYWLALSKGTPGDVYNICTGKGHKISEILNIYLKNTKVKIKIEKDPARMRQSDAPIYVGDASKFRKQTGWKPQIPFETALKDLLNYWRKEIAAGKA